MSLHMILVGDDFIMHRDIISMANHKTEVTSLLMHKS